MEKMRILLVADGVIETRELLDEVARFEKMGLEVDVALDRIGETREEIARYLTRMEHEGAQWWTPSDELKEKVRSADILVVHFSAVGSALMDLAPRLKLIGVLRSGVENVDLPSARARNIPVVSSPGRVAAPVADYAVGLMIAESRNIVRSSLNWSQGDWKIRFFNYPYSHNLAGKRIGIVGFGEIGRLVARRVAAFDALPVVYDPYVPDDAVRAAGCEPQDLKTLLKTCDFVTLHVRLSDATRHMIGKEQLALMKPTAILVNTARAGLIDEPALVEALKARAIGGAALDVFDEEPIGRENPLLQLDNVLLTPHLAGTTSNVAANSVAVLARDIERFTAGEPLKNLCK